MVTGSVAATIYGEPRLTNDIDLVVVLSGEDVPRVVKAFDPVEYYVPPAEIMEIEVSRPAHGHFNLIHTATSLKADIYPAASDPLHRWALARRQEIQVGTDTVWVAPPEYVIIRKLEYTRDGGSDKHARDIRAMLRELGDRIDRSTIVAEVDRRGLGPLWRAVS